jgi:hypothetical protein
MGFSPRAGQNPSYSFLPDFQGFAESVLIQVLDLDRLDLVGEVEFEDL